MATGLQAQIDKAAALIEARPYIQAFRGKMVVVKYGGSTMVDAGQVDTVPEDIAFMQSVGIRPVVIHGGGPAISERLEEQGVETRRINGLRVTDAATMQVVEDVLVGEVNAAIAQWPKESQKVRRALKRKFAGEVKAFAEGVQKQLRREMLADVQQTVRQVHGKNSRFVLSRLERAQGPWTPKKKVSRADMTRIRMLLTALPG